MRFSSPPAAYARVSAVPGGLALETSFHAQMIADLKRSVPAHARKWDGAHKRWIIAQSYGQVTALIVEQYLGIQLAIPTAPVTATTEIRLLVVEYIGRTKARDGSDAAANAWSHGGWTVIFPEAVLRDYFDPTPQRPDEKPTLYAILAVKKPARVEDLETAEVKSAYRRMARQWHPDLCHEPDATAMFKLIQHAYEVLSDPVKHRKYLAGLAFEASMKQAQQLPSYVTKGFSDAGYRSPLRCGYILCQGQDVLGRFLVSGILQWQDITDPATGKTMVVSWPAGADRFEVAWR